MKTLEYDITREFLVHPGGFSAPLEFLLESTGSLLPEVGDRIDMSRQPIADNVKRAYGTCAFVVHQVVLQPGFGDPHGKLARQEAEDWQPDSAVIVLLPLKGEKFSGFSANCQLIPQEAVVRKLIPMEESGRPSNQTIADTLAFARAFQGPVPPIRYA